MLSDGKNHICVNGILVSSSEHILFIRVKIVFSPSSSLLDPDIYLNMVLTSVENLNLVLFFI
jgi:hypothetical protein